MLTSLKLCERLSLACAVLSVPYFFIFHYFGLNFAGNMIILFVGVFLCSIALSKYGFEESSKFLLVFNASFLLFFYSLVLGKASGAYLVFFSIVPIPIMLFSPKHKASIILTTLCPIVLSYLLELMNYRWIFKQATLNLHASDIIHGFAMSTSFIFVLIAVYQFFIFKSDRQKLLELQQASIENELLAAQTIQESTLPYYPNEWGPFSIDHLYLPARKVGGDFIDIFSIDENRMGIVIADIVGKGIPASLMMVALKNIVTNVTSSGKSALDVVEKLNTLLLEHEVIQKYVPMIYGILDKNQQNFCYVNAGHDPGCLLRNNTITSFEFDGFPLGIDPHTKYKEHFIPLQCGDQLYLFTDGFPDLKNHLGQRLKEDGVYSLLLTHHSKPFQQRMHDLETSIFDFKNGCEQADDISILSVWVR